MKANFARALKAVLVHEGGYSNHPKDPGGATMQGVTQRVYDAFRAKRGEKPRSVKQIDKAELTEIYRAQYWNAVHGDDLPSGVDYAVFDLAVNSGPTRAIKILQQSLRGYSGRIDGQIGLATLRAVEEDDDNDALIDRMCDRRLKFLRALSTWPVFGKGWSKRVAGVRAMGKAMATGKTPPKAVFESAGAVRATDADIGAPPGKGLPDAITGAGGAVTTGSLGLQTQVTDAMDKLTPFAGYSATVGTILTYLAVAGAVMVGAGLVWRMWSVWRAKKIAEAVE